MRTREDRNVGILNAVPDQKGETAQYGAADTAVARGADERVVCESGEGGIELGGVELSGQTRLLLLVLRLGVKHIALGGVADKT